MNYKLPFSEYKLSDGRIFKPGTFFASDVAFIFPGIDYEVEQHEILKVLYRIKTTTLTLTGKWSSEAKDWVFDYLIGPSEDGAEDRGFIEKLIDPED